MLPKTKFDTLNTTTFYINYFSLTNNVTNQKQRNYSENISINATKIHIWTIYILTGARAHPKRTQCLQ